jgi:hypothetical protein
MGKRKYSSVYVPIGVVTLVVLTALLLWPTLVTAIPLTPKQEVDSAWRFAGDVGSYQYRTDVIQTTHPTARLENAGRNIKSTRMTVEGAIDQASETMNMTLWMPGAGKDGLQMKIEGGKSYGRVGSGQDWEELDNPTSIFAPGGDPLGFLAATENVKPNPATLSQDDSAAPDITNRSYTFDINGLEFARAIREQLEAEMRRNGELPRGMSLGMVSQYVDMRGHGEIWLGANGLPSRQVIHLEFPPEKGAYDWAEADIVTDFTRWDVEGIESQPSWAISRLVDDPSLLINDPLSLLPSPSSIVPPISEDMKQIGFILAVLGLMTAISIAAISNGMFPQVYAAVGVAVVFSLIATPVIQAHSRTPYVERQQQQRAEFERQQEQVRLLHEAEAKISGRIFNPLVDPLAGESSAQTMSVTSQSLTNEIGFGSLPAKNPAQLNVATCPNDADCDGLDDDVETLKLGTDPNRADTDGDNISDRAEVEGFIYLGQRWYLNPLSSDSNGDGQIDSIECPELEDVDADGNIFAPSGSQCGDTDGDGTPDVFDFDDDADGVPDIVDSSPDYVGDLNSNFHDQMSFGLTGYETGKSLLVDFEIRPTDIKHLWYTNNGLDWPDQDTQGQITRVNDVTFLDVNTGNSSPKADNGDIMLTPLLEVTIPAPPNNSANPSGGLPVLSSFSGDIASSELSQWLDEEALDTYGITVSQAEIGDPIYAYVPLAIIEDVVGDTPVAWGARMYYNTDNADWGSDHELRVVWMITALVDSCTAPDGVTFDDYCAENFDNWTTDITVIQTYYEDFALTGLSVQEHHGMEIAVVAQRDADTVDYEDSLWVLVNGLEQSFIRGDLSNGSRFV